MEGGVDPLMMEALLLFSSEDSDAHGMQSTDSALATLARSGGNARHSAGARGFAPYPPPVPLHPRQPRRPPKLKAAPKTQETTKAAVPRQRKPKPCTYAARRAEADRLRAMASQLEERLGELQQITQHRLQAQHKAERERYLAAHAQAENARLKELVVVRRGQIAQAQEAIRADQERRRHQYLL